jgi:hypothetical protein
MHALRRAPAAVCGANTLDIPPNHAYIGRDVVGKEVHGVFLHGGCLLFPHPYVPSTTKPNSNGPRGDEMAEPAPDLEEHLDEELLSRTYHALICVDSATARDDG